MNLVLKLFRAVGRGNHCGFFILEDNLVSTSFVANTLELSIGSTCSSLINREITTGWATGPPYIGTITTPPDELVFNKNGL